MAYLLQPETRSGFPALSHHTIGSLKGRVDTYINDPFVSRRHLAIEWTGEQWFLKDLSRNGTWVNGKRLPCGHYLSLKKNDRIQLASRDGHTLIAVDLSAPRDLLIPVENSDLSPIELHPNTPIPDKDRPEWWLAYDENAQQWFAHSRRQRPGTTRRLRHQDCLDCFNGRWQLFRALGCPATREAYDSRPSVSECELQFDVSQDEESTQLTVRSGLFQRDLGMRAHHYLLLLLARHRVAHEAKGYADGHQGWVANELLARELGLDLPHLNIQIYRARRQLARHCPELDGRALIERRGGNLRLGCPRFTIVKGGEAEYSPRQAHGSVDASTP